MSNLMHYVTQSILLIIGVQFAYSLLIKSIMGKVIVSLTRTIYYFTSELIHLLKYSYRMLIKFVFSDNDTDSKVVDFKEYKKRKVSSK